MKKLLLLAILGLLSQAHNSEHGFGHKQCIKQCHTEFCSTESCKTELHSFIQSQEKEECQKALSFKQKQHSYKKFLMEDVEEEHSESENNLGEVREGLREAKSEGNGEHTEEFHKKGGKHHKKGGDHKMGEFKKNHKDGQFDHKKMDEHKKSKSEWNGEHTEEFHKKGGKNHKKGGDHKMGEFKKHHKEGKWDHEKMGEHKKSWGKHDKKGDEMGFKHGLKNKRIVSCNGPEDKESCKSDDQFNTFTCQEAFHKTHATGYICKNEVNMEKKENHEQKKQMMGNFKVCQDSMIQQIEQTQEGLGFLDLFQCNQGCLNKDDKEEEKPQKENELDEQMDSEELISKLIPGLN